MINRSLYWLTVVLVVGLGGCRSEAISTNDGGGAAAFLTGVVRDDAAQPLAQVQVRAMIRVGGFPSSPGDATESTSGDLTGTDGTYLIKVGPPLVPPTSADIDLTATPQASSGLSPLTVLGIQMQTKLPPNVDTLVVDFDLQP